MPLPPHPLTITGGCNCRSIRYQINVPAFSSRPKSVYCTPGAAIPDDARIPFITIDHCNDCRRATGALLPFGLVTDVVTAELSFNSNPLCPASDLWSTPLDALQTSSTLGHYHSSAGRNRWFCRKCGTMLFYTLSEGVIPEDWGWPQMLDIWLGTVDRECLEKEYMKPERMLWCEMGVPWIRELARSGAGGVPEHPLTKIDKLVGDDVGEDLEELRTRVDGKVKG